MEDMYMATSPGLGVPMQPMPLDGSDRIMIKAGRQIIDRWVVAYTSPPEVLTELGCLNRLAIASARLQSSDAAFVVISQGKCQEDRLVPAQALARRFQVCCTRMNDLR